MKFLSFIACFVILGALSMTTSAQTFSNTNAFTIRDNTSASLYPSNVNVAGVTGTVSKVTVTLTGISHSYPDDIGVLLVSPTGVKVRLWSDAGGGDGGSGGGIINNVNVTFDDSAAKFLPDGLTGDPAITTGSYKPTMGTSGSAQGPAHPANFPAPAPASPYALTLSSFNGVNPNGNWSLYVDDDAEGDSGMISGGWSLTITTGGTTTTPPTRATLFDFTGNGRTDYTVFNNIVGGQPIKWKVLGNPALPGPNQAFIRIFDYGIGSDRNVGVDDIVPNDYRGDKKFEVAVRRRSEGFYYVAQFPLGTAPLALDAVVRWGNSTDTPGADGDYDGDGKDDYTVARLNTNNTITYFMLLSNSNTMRAVTFGLVKTGIIPQLLHGADFTGNGRDELVLAEFSDDNTNRNRPVTYLIGDAVNGTLVMTTNWGNYDTDYSITPADYTGDGKADLVAVRQNSTQAIWYVRNTATGTLAATPFGIGDPSFTNNDLPIRGDYDGDGRQDIAVWRPSTQTFYSINSSTGTLNVQGWGSSPTDIPLGILGTF